MRDSITGAAAFPRRPEGYSPNQRPRRCPAGILRCLAVSLLLLSVSSAEEPEYPRKSGEDVGSWLEEITGNIPPLRHDRGDRWPLILWEGVGFDPLAPEVHAALLERGIVQHVRIDTAMIATAKAIQKAGGPVILMEGRGGTWSYELGGDESEWAHRFDDGYKPSGRVRACPHRYAGFAVQAERVRGIMGAFADAGVTVDAVWADWEGDPYVGSAAGDRYEQASHCTRCRAELPAEIIGDEKSFLDYCWRLYSQLWGACLALPVLERFPRCAVTNWMILYSTPERTVRHWTDRVLVPNIPPAFTATNPVAYGNDKFFRAAWREEFTLDREHVDQLYMHLLLRMVSDDAENRRHFGPHVKSFPWVDRWCPDVDDPQIPMMSRPAYREALRHMWLRGVDGMQIFQPRRPGYGDIVRAEVEDAVAVYDEMLAYREFLDRGEVLNTEVPEVQDGGVLWSGLRVGDRALVRLCRQSSGEGTFEIEPWPGAAAALAAGPEGRTFLLERTAAGVLSEEMPR